MAVLRAAIATLCVLATLGLTCGDDEVVPSCDIDVYGVFDNSGSMDDLDDTCLAYLQDNVYGSSYTSKKACWEIINIYMKSAYSAVQKVCASANQGNPRLSLTIFRCPNTGKDRKTLLEPTNDQTLIDEAFVDMADQQMKGYSCAWGALDQVQYYINNTKAMTNAELGVPPEVADPNANATRYPLILIFTDGLLGSDDAAREAATKLRDDTDNTVVALNAFPTSKMIKKLENYANSTLIFEAEDLSTLNQIGFRLGSYVISLDDLAICSDEQIACAEAVKSAIELERNASASCETMSQLYTALASCASTGCTGIDLTDEKDACLDDIAAQADGDSCEPSKACKDLALHINAQSYTYQSEPGAGLDASSATPSFYSRNAKAQDEVSLGSGEMGLAFEVTGYSGGNSAPVVGNTGDIIIGSIAQADGAGGRLVRVNAENGEVVWELEGTSSDVSFEAPAVVGPNGSDDVFVGASDGSFYRVSESDGSVKQVWNLGARIRAAAAVPANADYVIVATDAVPGVQPVILHKLSTADDPESQDPPQAWRRPACSNETYDYVMGGVHISDTQAVFVPCHSGRLDRFSFLTGQTQWRMSLGGELTGAPIFDDNGEAFYAAVHPEESGDSTAVLKIDFVGTVAWNATVTSAIDADIFMDASAGTIYVLDRAGLLTQVAASSGAELVGAQTVFTNPQLSMYGLGPDTDGNLVFFSGATLVVAPAGNLTDTLQFELDAKVTSLPLLVNDGIYLATQDSLLTRVEPSSDSAQRRVLASGSGEGSDGWPGGAIAATVVLAIIFVILSIALCVLVRRS